MIGTIELARRYESVLERVEDAAARSGRSANEITVVAVTKTWPAELVVAAYEGGMRHFGENRPEELAEKRPKVEDALGSERPVIWHLIGPVQSRKARLAAACADYFHALSREKTATRLSAALTQVNRVLPCFVEVNVSGEASKLGLDLSNWESDATQRENLRSYFRTISDLPGLAASGLMTMAPWDANPSFIRSVFRRTRELAQWLESEMPAVPRLMLSMGMTDDFEIAIEEGATHVRVGRALFGERRNQVTLGE